MSGGTQKPAFAIGVPNDINAFHYYTVRSSFLFAPLVVQFQTTDSELSSEISRLTCITTYRYALRPMIPDNARGLCITAAAGTELATSYSLGTVKNSSLTKGLYNPKTFIVHAASLDQAFAHCPKFQTAASRRSLDRVSVPVWPIALSGRLRIVALVSHYLTN